ncbi:hypothetical protein GGD83_001475 [Rhodoblastus sphagnicola]|nr:hypothetical protein [Rhodoblastus sphagnicola]
MIGVIFPTPAGNSFRNVKKSNALGLFKRYLGLRWHNRTHSGFHGATM